MKEQIIKGEYLDLFSLVFWETQVMVTDGIVISLPKELEQFKRPKQNPIAAVGIGSP